MNIKLTKQTMQLLHCAIKIATDEGKQFIESQHLLMAMTRVRDASASYALGRKGIVAVNLSKSLNKAVYLTEMPLEVIPSYIPMNLKQDPKIEEYKSSPVQFMDENIYVGSVEGFENYSISEVVKDALEFATDMCYQLSPDGRVETYWILSGITQNDQSNAYRLLHKTLINVESRVGLQDIKEYFSPMKFNLISTKTDGYQEHQNLSKEKINNRIWNKLNDPDYSLLEDFTTDLTNKASRGLLMPVVGREKEIRQMTLSLIRRDKNNVALIGPGGVGKSAIVDGLAIKIANNEIPPLVGKRILQFNLSELISTISGDYSKAILRLIDEMKQEKNIVLFIDEIHMLGKLKSLTDTLKPIMARSDFRIIGATTPKEWETYIGPDSALVRRFEKVLVDEPSIDETIIIIENIKESYEKFHRVQYTKETIENAVKLSKQYLPQEKLPDSAITVLDNAAALLNLESKNPYLNTYDSKLKELKNQLSEAKEIDFNDLEIQQVRNNIIKLTEDYQRKLVSTNIENDGNWPVVTPEYVFNVIKTKTKIPLKPYQGIDQDEIQQQEKEMEALLGLKEHLRKKVIGQHLATDLIADTIIRSKTGFHHASRPLGVFMFAGTTGTGKTEVAKVLADELFNSRNSLIRFDMSEYQLEHEVSKLIGSPPGYVGYYDGGQLTNAIKKNPYSIILFDEIEKAHPKIYDIFLQLFDDARLTDSFGFTHDFSNTVIIMTTNIGASQIRTQKTVGFGRQELSSLNVEDVKNQVHESALSYFRPEFLNRIDEIVTFNPLKMKDLLQITELILEDEKILLQDNGFEGHFDNSAIEFLTLKYFDPINGARPIKRGIQKIVETNLSQMILAGKIKKGDKIQFSANVEKLEVKVVK